MTISETFLASSLANCIYDDRKSCFTEIITTREDGEVLGCFEKEHESRE